MGTEDVREFSGGKVRMLENSEDDAPKPPRNLARNNLLESCEVVKISDTATLRKSRLEMLPWRLNVVSTMMVEIDREN